MVAGDHVSHIVGALSDVIILYENLQSCGGSSLSYAFVIKLCSFFVQEIANR